MIKNKTEHNALIIFYIYINESKWNNYPLIIEIDNGGLIDNAQASLQFESISNKEYQKRNYEKISFIILLLSLAFFSVFTGVKNLKDIIEKDTNKDARPRI